MSVRDMGKEKRCERCGKKFIVTTPTRKYCSKECAIKVQKEQDRLYKGKANIPVKKRKTKSNKKKKYLSLGLYHRGV